MSGLVLGIDVGTTMVKAAVFGLASPGRPLAIGRCHSKVSSPRPGWSETDPDELLRAVYSCIRDATTQLDDAREIGAVGLSGTACGAWLIAEGRPLRPAILWNDGRAAGVLAEWEEQGHLGEVFDISGNAMFPGYTLPVLHWLARHEPEPLARAERFVFCKDWIRANLTGCWSSEETDASFAPFDIKARTWSDRLADLVGVPDFRRLRPDLAPGDHSDPLLPEIARDLGLRAGIPVATGVTDIVAGCVGGGAVMPGEAVTILGTSANSSVVTPEPAMAPRQVGIMAAAPAGRWLRTMVNTSGSMTLDWAAHLFADGDVAALVEAAGCADPERVPILVPYLADAGIVSPYVDPFARGAFFGLRAGAGLNDLARATLDGLAFTVADGYEIVPAEVDKIVVVGGAAKSHLLCQTIADAVNAQVVRPHGEEFGARGAALLAAVAAGLVGADGFGALAQTFADRDTFEPDPSRVATRLSRYRACRDMARASGDLWS